MKKVLTVIAVVVFALALAACTKNSFGVQSNGERADITAEGIAEGTASTSITVKAGYGIVINPLLDRGSITVHIEDSKGATVFDEKVEGKIAVLVDVSAGEYALKLTANKATGTMSILPYDKVAQAQAAGTIDDALNTATGKNTEELGVGMANPWTDAETAAEAAANAKLDSFTVPPEGFEISLGKLDAWSYRSMIGIAQANGGVADASLLVRKGVFSDDSDISGDYATYTFKWMRNVGNVEVTCFGNVEGKAAKTIWVVDDTAYCLLARIQNDDDETFGLGYDDVSALVGGIN